MKKQIPHVILLLALFAARLAYGLCSEFWFEDELQVYLIGLKAYTTQTWPYYGPDVVYTQTQIPGALQGLLISAALFVWHIPESPVILLNILSFLSLGLLAWYISRRIPTLPRWLVWLWVMSLTWTVDYSTRVVNPSYVIVFSIPFFVALFEVLPIYPVKLLPARACFFIMGLCTACILQIHLSYVLLFPFMGLALYFNFGKGLRMAQTLARTACLLAGALCGAATLLPTVLLNDQAKGIGANVVFNPRNYEYVLTILTRYLSFASFEVPYIMGGSTAERLGVIRYSPWMAPFALYLLLFGFLLVGVFMAAFFGNKQPGAWQKIKYLTGFGFIMLFLSFFFSVKAPSSHTYCLLLPLPVVYSFYCYEWLWPRFRVWKKLMYAALVCCLVFYAGQGWYNYRHKSLYQNRASVQRAIDEKNYRLLGERRADGWGYGY